MKIIISLFIITSCITVGQSYKTEIKFRSAWAKYFGIIEHKITNYAAPGKHPSRSRTFFIRKHLHELEVRIYSKKIDIDDDRELLAILTDKNGKTFNLLLSDSVNYLNENEYESFYYELELETDSRGWFDLKLGYNYFDEIENQYCFELIDENKVYFFR